MNVKRQFDIFNFTYILLRSDYSYEQFVLFTAFVQLLSFNDKLNDKFYLN